MTKINSVILFFVLSAFLFWLSLPIYSGDIKNHVVWAESIIENGPLGFYERTFRGFAFPNYPPLAMLLFVISSYLYTLAKNAAFLLNNLPIFPSNIVHFLEWENTLISFLKLPAVFSTVGLGFLNYYIVKNLKPNLNKYISTILLVINPSIIYLSAVWGQIDVLPIFFILLSFYLLFKNKIWLSLFIVALSLLTKQTVILFWGIYMLTLLKFKGIKWVIKGWVISFIIFYLSYLPFHPPSLTWPLELYKLNFSLVAFSVSENSINLWGMLYNYKSSDDTVRFLNITLQQWGYLLFLVSSLPAVLFYIKSKVSLNRLILFCTLISLNYYFFLTRMHERYLAPAVIFLTILALINKRHFIPLLYFSILYFLNLYRGLLQPDNKFLVGLVQNNDFLNVLVIIYSGFIIYFSYIFLNKKND